MRGLVIVLAAALVGCGDPHGGPSDAGADAEIDAMGIPGPCWPDVVPTPKGTATLGTGYSAFEAMPAVLPIEYGAQDGYNFVGNVRMTGFAPGNAQDVLDPGNPRTRVRAFFDDTNVPLNFYSHCPYRNGYVPSAAGGYELVTGLGIIFENCWRADRLIGQKIRIELEIMDDTGGYATDVKIVTAAAPTGPYPNETNTPGCIH